jgi:hypothetical protein
MLETISDVIAMFVLVPLVSLRRVNDKSFMGRCAMIQTVIKNIAEKKVSSAAPRPERQRNLI